MIVALSADNNLHFFRGCYVSDFITIIIDDIGGIIFDQLGQDSMEVNCVNTEAKGIVKVGKYYEIQSFGRSSPFYGHTKFIQ